MIAATIGRKFLNLYNNLYHTSLSPKEFFDRAYFSLFYNHPKYMYWATNSPFVQMKKGQKPELLSVEERMEKLQNLHQKIATAAIADASVAIGFPAAEEKEFATTSGQVTDLSLPLKKDDIYLSWIGSGLGIGVSGGLSIFFDHPIILKTLFEGWKIYREYLNDPAYSRMRGNQINTWNGQWLAHALSNKYRAGNPTLNFKGLESASDGTIEVKTISWTKVLIAVAQRIPVSNLTGYIYSLGQTNVTVGFIPFQLPQITYPLELYKKLFGENEFLINEERIEGIYGSAHSFQKACQKGAVGLAALEPKDLRGFIPVPGKEAKMPDYKKAKEETFITFKTYLTWLLAMLNNEELWQVAGDAAGSFLHYESGAAKARNDRRNNVQALLDAPNRRLFIEALTKLVSESSDNDAFVELAALINKMPADNYQYFITLVRFRYAEKSNSKTEKIKP